MGADRGRFALKNGQGRRNTKRGKIHRQELAKQNKASNQGAWRTKNFLWDGRQYTSSRAWADRGHARGALLTHQGGEKI